MLNAGKTATGFTAKEAARKMISAILLIIIRIAWHGSRTNALAVMHNTAHL